VDIVYLTSGSETDEGVAKNKLGIESATWSPRSSALSPKHLFHPTDDVLLTYDIGRTREELV